MKEVRVLLVDDSRLAREAIISILKTDPQFLVIGEAEDGQQGLEMARTLMPDLILMDIQMPRMDGLLTTRLIKRELPYVTVVILTVSDHPQDLFEAIKSGAQGYLLKNLEPQDWLEYLRSLANGDWAMPKDMAAHILAEFAKPSAQPAPRESTELTEREVEVLRLVATARSNREIAASLFISEHTVKNHIKNIMHKLHLKSRVELAVYANRYLRA